MHGVFVEMACLWGGGYVTMHDCTCVCLTICVTARFDRAYDFDCARDRVCNRARDHTCVTACHYARGRDRVHGHVRAHMCVCVCVGGRGGGGGGWRGLRT